MGYSAFQSSAFQNNAFQIGATTTIILLGGGPGGSKWDKKKHEYFFTPAWQVYEREMQALEDSAVSKEHELHQARESAPKQSNEIVEQDRLAAYEAQARQDIQAREQFLIYEQKMLKEISDLRIRRDRLIRQRNEEAVVISILLDMPPLH
jgi:hypothetical protein